MAPRTIRDSLRGDDITIPFWLRLGGAVIAVVVTMLVVVSAFTSPGRPPPVPPPRAQPAETAEAPPSEAPGPVALPGLPVPLPSTDFANPGSVAGAFAVADQTWIAPDGPPGSAARVEPYVTAQLFTHFPEPTSTPSPSALAAVDNVTVSGSSSGTRLATVSLTQHLLGQDGGAVARPLTSTLWVTVERQSNGTWLVAAFSPR
ncbi:MAG: hypothetical protein M3137_06610 [Actinomycetota bacterium]|nr:hypothetical protein [Actinomycetota bacterium]